MQGKEKCFLQDIHQQQENGQNRPTRVQKPLTDAQLSRMYRIGETAGYPKQHIDSWICKKYGQQDPHNMTRAQYDETCEILEGVKGGNKQ
mgnify:CR=1 FL=1